MTFMGAVLCVDPFGKVVEFYHRKLYKESRASWELSFCPKGGGTDAKEKEEIVSFPRCPKLIEGSFCDEHGKQENRRYEKYDRDSVVCHRYGRAWKRIRDRYAAKHLFCEECQKKGLYRLMKEVHHKLAAGRGWHSLREQPRVIVSIVPCKDLCGA